jgi:D-alanyl-D-alanine carboxypeptidase
VTKEARFVSRFKNDPTVKSSVVAKTGVTNYVISLAGWLDDVKQVPFAFLITTFTQAQRVNAKLAIDELVSTIYKNTLQYPMLNESESISSSPQDLPLFLAVPKD